MHVSKQSLVIFYVSLSVLLRALSFGMAVVPESSSFSIFDHGIE